MSLPIKLTLPMPRLGETMEEGTIADWLVASGQSFKRGDPLLEVETDKTLVEYPALGDGTLLDILVESGDVVEVGMPIAVIETEDVWAGIDITSAPDPQGHAPTENVADPADFADQTRLRATPLARRIAKQEGIALDQVAGTGRRGRIEAEDVRASVASAPSAPRVIRAATGTAAPVCCVHGFAGLGSNWAALRASLQRVGLKSSAPDLPGHGRNPAQAPDVDTLVDWLADDLAERPGPVHLVGHSLGAHVATQVALRDPARVARLTLIAPAGCGMQINGTFLSGMAAAAGMGELSHLMRLLGTKASQLDARALSAMAQDLQAQRLAALAGAAAHGDVQRIDTIGPLRSLSDSLPVTAIFGLADQIIPREHVFNLPPAVACHMIESGHMPQWDAPEEVASIIAAQ